VAKRGSAPGSGTALTVLALNVAFPVTEVIVKSPKEVSKNVVELKSGVSLISPI
jgi:hypothetical protein